MNAAESTAPPDAEDRRIVRLVGVYDADGTLRGEVAYWVGARLGRRHCSLCEITHGVFRRRREFTDCRVGMPVPFDTYHRNDQPDEVRSAAGGRAPIVAAVTNGGVVVLLVDAEIEACAGSVDLLEAAIDAAAARLGLSWPSPS